jgi:photosystem II stability/assembly factor-like uncharacterized protein
MRAWILAIVLFALTAGADSGKWRWLNPLPDGNGAADFDFTSERDGWVVGPVGTVLHTVDHGATWKSSWCDSLFDFGFVKFTDSMTGWIAGRWDIFKTSDGGAHWIPQYSNHRTFIYDFNAVDSLHAWATIAGDSLNAFSLATTDGGKSWRPQRGVDSAYLMYVACFVNQSAGWTAGYDGYVFRTSDGGTHWEKQFRVTEPSARIYSISFVDSLYGWLAVSRSDGRVDKPIYRTTDGGRSWTPQSVLSFGSVDQVQFISRTVGMAVAGDTILTTGDGGENWSIRGVFAPGLHRLFPPDRTPGFTYGNTQRVAISGGEIWIVRRASATRMPISCSAQRGNGWIAAGWSYRIGSAMQDCEIIAASHTDSAWTSFMKDSGFAITDLFFADSLHGWAAGSNGSILHTVDAGVSWSAGPGVERDTAARLFFFDNNKGLAGGKRGGIFATGNGGASWDSIGSLSGHHRVADLFFLDSLTGWAVDGFVYKTSDGGKSWDQGLGSGVLNSVFFSDPRHGWAVGGNYSSGDPPPTRDIFHTADGGRSWQRQLSESDWPLNDVAFFDSLNGWAVGYRGAIFSTIDGGKTWQRDRAITGQDLLSITVAGNRAVLTGGNGVILANTFQASVDVRCNAAKSIKSTGIDWSLRRNGGRSSIVVRLDRPSAVEASLYDLRGRLILKFHSSGATNRLSLALPSKFSEHNAVLCVREGEARSARFCIIYLH